MPERKRASRSRDASDGSDGEAAVRGFWSGTIAFGLVSIPVQLLPANRPASLSMRMVDEDGTPLVRRYYCSRDERPVTREEIARGYDVSEGRYVVVTDEELRGLAPQKSREIDLRRFVDVSDLDPFYFERAYYLLPHEAAKAYGLLAQAMEESGKAGIATFVMRDREYLVAIIAEGGVLRAETMRFPEQLRSPADVGLTTPKKPPADRVRALERAIAGLHARTLKPDEVKDERAESLRRLAERKLAKGKDVVRLPEGADEEAQGAEIIDLMAVLKRSLGEAGARSGRTKAAPASRTKTSAAPGKSLERLSRDELYARATRLKIRGRTKMDKQALIEAIRASA